MSWGYIAFAVISTVASVGAQQKSANDQRKAVKQQRHEQDVRYKAELAAAEAQEEKSERQSSVRAAKARQVAMAVGAQQKGRSGTIKTGGLGSALTTEKSITGG
jgi:hypothetical protein